MKHILVHILILFSVAAQAQPYLGKSIKVGDSTITAEKMKLIWDATNSKVGSSADNALSVSSGAVNTRKAWQTATDGATVTFNLATGYNWKVTIAGNRTFAFSNAQDGDYITIRIKQDATGSRTVTWPSSVKWSGGTVPTLTTAANATDIFTFVYDSTDALWYQSGQDVK